MAARNAIMAPTRLLLAQCTKGELVAAVGEQLVEVHDVGAGQVVDAADRKISIGDFGLTWWVGLPVYEKQISAL